MKDFCIGHILSRTHEATKQLKDMKQLKYIKKFPVIWQLNNAGL